MSELIPLSFHKILQSRSYTVIIVGTEEKKFAIYAEPQVGHYLQMQMVKANPLRPNTFAFIEHLLEGLGGKILQVVINDVQDTTYFARLFIEIAQEKSKLILELDARPSDCIILALSRKIPFFCNRDVLNKTIGVTD